MSQLTPLSRPLARRIGRLVVRITAEGLELRGYRRRQPHRLSWERVASLLGPDRPLLAEAEEQLGRDHLAAIGAELPPQLDEQEPTEATEGEG